MKKFKVAILGGGLAGGCAALKLAQNQNISISVYDRQPIPVNAASLHNEGKLHLGYVYGADPDSATHRIMVQGSLSFLNYVESLTNVGKEKFSVSKPFVYAVPKDSQLTLQQQTEHFARVDQCIEEAFDSQETIYHSSKPQKSQFISNLELTSYLSSERLQGALQTDEYSVNTTEVANVIGASLLSSPSITFIGETEVQSALKYESGEYEIKTRKKGGQEQVDKYDAVINCLWEDRLRIDQSLGINPPRPWLVRYKAAISGHSKVLETESGKYPSLTLITGAYGDFVNHGNGYFYLSWYPKCKLGESREMSFTDIKKAVGSVSHQKLIKESFDSMAGFLPGLLDVHRASSDISVGGGYIFAWGKSDITDPVSGLHQRHLIGVDVHDRWLSVNTGKYCTAPLFGVNAAETLTKELLS